MSAHEVSLNTLYRQRNFYCQWFIVALFCIVCGALWAQTTQAGSDLDKAQKNLERVKSRIATIQARMRAQDSARTNIARDLENSERKAAQLVLEGRRLKKVQTRLNISLSELSNSASRLRQQRQLLRQQLARQLRVAYAIGREGRLKLVINGQEPGDLPRLLRYHDYFSAARRQRISKLNTANQRLQETLASIQKQQRQLQNLAKRQDQQTLELAGERDLRASALMKTERELSNQRQRLAALNQNKQRLTNLLKELSQAIDDIPAELEPPKSFRALRGTLPWPVKGRLVQGYSNKAPAGQTAQGVILRAQGGLEVRAVAHGRVVFADWLRGFGQMIIIDHGAGYMSLYGYNQSLLLEPGEWVRGGDAIATVGDSGGQAENGLYFEIRRSGKPLNPAQWCSTRARFKSTAG